MKIKSDKIKEFVALSCAALGLVQAVQAATLRVEEYGVPPVAYDNFDKAIAAANSGDTLLVVNKAGNASYVLDTILVDRPLTILADSVSGGTFNTNGTWKITASGQTKIQGLRTSTNGNILWAPTSSNGSLLQLHDVQAKDFWANANVELYNSTVCASISRANADVFGSTTGAWLDSSSSASFIRLVNSNIGSINAKGSTKFEGISSTFGTLTFGKGRLIGNTINGVLTLSAAGVTGADTVRIVGNKLNSAGNILNNTVYALVFNNNIVAGANSATTKQLTINGGHSLNHIDSLVGNTLNGGVNYGNGGCYVSDVQNGTYSTLGCTYLGSATKYVNGPGICSGMYGTWTTGNYFFDCGQGYNSGININAPKKIIVMNNYVSKACYSNPVTISGTPNYAEVIWNGQSSNCTNPFYSGTVTNAANNATGLTSPNDKGNPHPIWNDVDGTRNDLGANGGPDSQLNYFPTANNNAQIFNVSVPRIINQGQTLNISVEGFDK
jgi:hypothetical protein